MKRIVIYIIAIILLAGGWYAYRISTGKVKRLTEVETQEIINSPDLIAAFEKDTAAAGRKFLGKIIEVSGHIKSVEKEDNAATVILGEAGSMSSVRCSMDTGYVKEVTGLNPGNKITVKGACTGFNADEMGLGSDVVLNRCILIPQKE
jgi:hypothetical protein